MILYNLFPRLVGTFYDWIKWLDHIRSMGFTWIYVNPFHLPGYSGSLYAVKDYGLYHPMFSVGNDDFHHVHQQKGIGDQGLKAFLDAAHARGLKVAMDLVVNHTATDSPLVRQHPEWYRWRKGGKIVHPGARDGRRRVVWGDLAQLDHRQRPETEGLRLYLRHIVRHYVWMGFDGFRCDAAYKVPSHTWRFLIRGARSERKDVVFMAETLGCSLKQTLRVSRAGFDYVFNGFKWWNLQDGGFIGAQNALAAFFSAGVMMPLGFEFGARRMMDVLRMKPDDLEPPYFHLKDDIAYVNRIKQAEPVFQAEARTHWLDLGPGVCGFAKEAHGQRAVVVAHVWGGDRPVRLEPGLLGPGARVVYGLRRLEHGGLDAALVRGEVFASVSDIPGARKTRPRRRR
jgi:starch synthase (maltosyl-transferring)